MTRRHSPAATLILLLSLAAAQAVAAPPDEGDCPSVDAPPSEESSTVDAAPVVLREGMVVDQESLLILRRLVPEEIWRNREVFFHEGMRMEIGACYRRYVIPRYYRSATEREPGSSSDVKRSAKS